ncbi:MAG: anti-sigma factor [Pseudomonadales bacterium]|nr:anti-sigma factor [Pseudomonadales bacterium]
MDESEDKTLAFEYVLGTLRGAERKAFQARLQTDDTLAKEVRFWEDSMMPLSESIPPLEPKPDTFKNIQAKINQRSSSTDTSTVSRFWERLLPWKMATSFALMMFLAVSLVYFNGLNQTLAPNTDYVAVLVDEADEPILTALTASEDNLLWLKWENWQPPKGHSLQLWAKSRRDGQVRPLLVFNENELKEVLLDEATLRLIKDSSHLIITEEEIGGSAIDEPSEKVIATGVCIRLKSIKNNA